MWDLYLTPSQRDQVLTTGRYRPEANKPPSAKFIDDNNNVVPAVEELLDTEGLTHASLKRFLKRGVSIYEYNEIIEALGTRHVVKKDHAYFWAAK